MKRSAHLRLALMAAAIPAAVGGCDNPAITGDAMADGWQGTAVDCSTADLMRTDACKAELERMIATSPRYGSQQECEGAVGGECARTDESGQSAWIGPTTGFVSGFLLAQVLDEVGDAFERKRRHGYTGYGGGYRSSYPASTGRGSYPAADARQAPTRAITQSRSGFGSKSSARSSFGRGG